MQKIKQTSDYKKSLKGRILLTAMTAFGKHGIKAVKMDDIAQMLGISKRTLYELYKDKEELLYQGLTYFDQKNKESMSDFAQHADSVMDIIIEAYQRKVVQTSSVNPQFYEDIERYPKVVKYLNQEHEQTHEQFLKFMERGVKEGYFRNDVDYELVSLMFNAIGKYVMTEHLHSRYSNQQLFANMLLIPFRGLCTEKGLQAIENSALVGNHK